MAEYHFFWYLSNQKVYLLDVQTLSFAFSLFLLNQQLKNYNCKLDGANILEQHTGHGSEPYRKAFNQLI